MPQPEPQQLGIWASSVTCTKARRYARSLATEWRQGLKLCPHGYQQDPFLLHCNRNSFFTIKKKLYWGIVDLQYCISDMVTTKWISYTYTYIPFFFFLVLGLHPRHMEVPRRGVQLELQLLAYHSNARSEPCLQPTPLLMAMLDP